MRLVLNNFEQLYQKNQENLLLGNWCDPDHNKSFKKIIHKYHWENTEKLEKDYKYLDSLIIKVHSQLGKKLEKIHKTNFGTNYWNIVLNPWVEFFITIAFDKWETITSVQNNFNVKEVAIFNYKQKKIPKDYYEFLDLFKSEEWNHYIFGEIIKFKNHSKCKINFIEKNVIKFSKNLNKPKFYKFIFDRIFSIIQKKNRVLFLDHYFGKLNYIKMCSRLNQLPRIFCEFYKDINFPNQDNSKRNELNLNLNTNDFEKFLSKIIFQNIPICFLEGYNQMQKNVLDINLNTDLIVTGNRDFVSDLARFWTAYQTTKNKKLILSEHGGGIPYKYMHYNITNQIFNDQIIWVKNKIFTDGQKIKQQQLTAGRLINLKEISLKKTNAVKNKFISLITMESYLHAKQCIALPSSLILEDFKQKKDLLNLLKDKNIRFKIKPFKNRGWNLSKKYKYNFGKNSLVNLSTKDLIKKSKLLICGYPETPLMESMISGVPTLLLYLEKYWKFENDYQELIKDMADNKMLFTSSKKAFEHISNIHENPYEWWNSNNVLRVRKKFHLECGKVSDDWLNEWQNYLEEKLKNKS